MNDNCDKSRGMFLAECGKELPNNMMRLALKIAEEFEIETMPEPEESQEREYGMNFQIFFGANGYPTYERSFAPYAFLTKYYILTAKSKSARLTRLESVLNYIINGACHTIGEEFLVYGALIGFMQAIDEICICPESAVDPTLQQYMAKLFSGSRVFESLRDHESRRKLENVLSQTIKDYFLQNSRNDKDGRLLTSHKTILKAWATKAETSPSATNDWIWRLMITNASHALLNWYEPSDMAKLIYVE